MAAASTSKVNRGRVPRSPCACLLKRDKGGCMTKVLLVDDEKLIQRSLEKTLLRAGFDVITASDCKSGSETFKQNANTVDIAVLDLNMPSFDGTPKTGAGLDLLDDLKKQKANVPVVILTAY